jgi:hypothetical protein
VTLRFRSPFEPAHFPPLKTFLLNVSIVKAVATLDWARTTSGKMPQPEEAVAAKMRVFAPLYPFRLIMADYTLGASVDLFILRHLTLEPVKHDFDWNGIFRGLRV